MQREGGDHCHTVQNRAPEAIFCSIAGRDGISRYPNFLDQNMERKKGIVFHSITALTGWLWLTLSCRVNPE
jgi:hypothetical protein